MPRNPTEAQIEASRRNGARSKGPVTPEGKQTISQNACRLSVNPRRLADSLLLPGESSAALESFVTSILNEYPPANEIELGYINMAIAAQWRLRRIHAIEQASLLTAAAANAVSTTINTPNGLWEIPAAQVAKSFKEVHGEKGHASIYQVSESRYGRQYTHALQQLRLLQASREKAARADPEILGPPEENDFSADKPEMSQYLLDFDVENKPEKPENKPENGVNPESETKEHKLI